MIYSSREGKHGEEKPKGMTSIPRGGRWDEEQRGADEGASRARPCTRGRLFASSSSRRSSGYAPCSRVPPSGRNRYRLTCMMCTAYLRGMATEANGGYCSLIITVHHRPWSPRQTSASGQCPPVPVVRMLACPVFPCACVRFPLLHPLEPSVHNHLPSSLISIHPGRGRGAVRLVGGASLSLRIDGLKTSTTCGDTLEIRYTWEVVWMKPPIQRECHARIQCTKSRHLDFSKENGSSRC